MEVVGTSRQGTSSGNGDASIDMVRLVKSIREKLDKLSSPSPECCIYKVPKKLKKINEEAYTPLRVSIGPLHHGKEGLEDMEEHKLRYFNDFMWRSGKSLEELVKIMEEMEKEIRDCYLEPINLESENFLEIILVDAAFIVVFLLKCWTRWPITPNDRIFGKQRLINDVRNDTMSYVIHHSLDWFKKENIIQELPALKDINPSEVKHFLDLLRSCLIPMKDSHDSVPEEKSPSASQASVPEEKSHSKSQASILEENSPSDLQDSLPEEKSPLVPEEKSPSNSQASVSEEISLSVTEEKSPSDSQASVPEEKSPSKVKQIIDCIISHLIPRQSLQQTKRKFDIPSATELREAGVKFKVSSSKNLFDIKFSGNILEIPYIQIADPTERLLRNIIAYEQCHCYVKFFGDYTMIMDYLINTSKDVELLVQAKIIENWLSDNNDVSNLFNGLNKEVYISYTYYFTELHKELNDYCEIPCHKWKATLRQDYCSTPWRVLSIIVAAILLGLTFIQSLCSLVSCNK
ncbi:hypothetical protein HYC85_023237 [Camellia sinensis]|uniref:Uncharacterized protein n=1 Tax=Camellia sinensis TaxID=4442 RepID=A0A7J7GHT4_CAMSI|nr:hypothetical protein HYC85_023237 [Camellia sinensis]